MRTLLLVMKVTRYWSRSGERVGWL